MPCSVFSSSPSPPLLLVCSVCCAAPSDEEVQNAELTRSRRWTEHLHSLPLYADQPKISQKAARESGSIHLESGCRASVTGQRNRGVFGESNPMVFWLIRTTISLFTKHQTFDIDDKRHIKKNPENVC